MPSEDGAGKVAPPKAAPRSIAAKLSEILGEVGTLTKAGKNETLKYSFARESDLVEMLRPKLAERHLFLSQSVTAHSRDELYKTRSDMIMWMTTLTVSFMWRDGDTGEVLEGGDAIGYGADTGDKGVYKAHTGALKYFLMKTFLVSTGDDPEADEKVDKAEAARGAARGSRVASTHRPTPTAQPGTTRGGHSTTATNPQLDEVGRLGRELGFNVPRLAAFTGKVLGDDKINQETPGATLKAYIDALGTEQMGQLIVAMTAALPQEDADDDDPFAGTNEA